MHTAIVLLPCALAALGSHVLVHAASLMENKMMPIKMQMMEKAPTAVTSQSRSDEIRRLVRQNGEVPCDAATGLAAGQFECKNMNLVHFLDGHELGSPWSYIRRTYVSDLWGWTDARDGHEYALVGMFDGTSLVDITNPRVPKVLGFLMTTDRYVDRKQGYWRDIKVIGNVAYIGSEIPGHGVQAFDLQSLKNMPRGANDWGMNATLLDAHYVAREVGSTHNLVTVESAGKLFALGMSASDPQCPSGSLAIFDVAGAHAPKPKFEQCYTLPVKRGGNPNQAKASTYVHDAHCVKYHGPDADYQGDNICILFAETAIVVFHLDTMKPITTFTYDTHSYVHQGWLSEDHRTLFATDEADELDRTMPDNPAPYSRTYIFDLADLDNAHPRMTYHDLDQSHPSVDHNLYVKDNKLYQAAFTSGARIREIQPDGLSIREVAYFDVDHSCDCVGDVRVAAADDPCQCTPFAGTWTVFPYFASKIRLAGAVFEGLYILRETL